MKDPTINLRDLLFVVADPNSYLCMIVHSMLRSFGANKVIEVRDSLGVVKALTGQKIDILLCDAKLPRTAASNSPTPSAGTPTTRTARCRS